jgi:uncharacterized lipoprotein YajG
MSKSITIALLLFALAGCSTQPTARAYSSPCDAGEATYACQVERYNNIGI